MREDRSSGHGQTWWGDLGDEALSGRGRGDGMSATRSGRYDCERMGVEKPGTVRHVGSVPIHGAALDGFVGHSKDAPAERIAHPLKDGGGKPAALP